MSPAEQSQIERGFRLLDSRLDDVRALNAEQHKENIGKFERVTDRLGDIEIAMEGYGQQVKTLFSNIQRLEGRPAGVDLSSFRWYIAIYMGGVCTVTGVVAALAYVLHLLKVI